MTTFSTRRAIAGALVVLVATVVAPSVGARVDVHSALGSWSGFLQQRPDPGATPPEPEEAALVVATQDGRRFSASFSAGDLSCRLDGTLSGGGHMSATGGCGPQSRLVLSGETSEAQEVGIIAPCIFEGRWTLTSGGASRRGDLVLLHVEEGSTEAAVGQWDGTATDDGAERARAMTAQLVAGRPGSGRVGIGDAGFHVVYDMSVRPEPDMPRGFALVGGGDAGLLVVTGRFHDPPERDAPPTVDGSYSRRSTLAGPVARGTFSMAMSAGGA